MERTKAASRIRREYGAYLDDEIVESLAKKLVEIENSKKDNKREDLSPLLWLIGIALWFFLLVVFINYFGGLGFGVFLFLNFIILGWAQITR